MNTPLKCSPVNSGPIKYFIVGVAALLLTFVVPLHAANAQPISDSILAAVENSPSVLAAKADIERAKASAKLLRVGPYEFEAVVTGARRKSNDLATQDNEYDEWSVGLSRTVRLPGKRRIDMELAKIELKLAKALYQQTAMQQQFDLIDIWSEWRKAKLLSITSQQQAQDASRLAKLERAKVKNGAGRQVNADQLQAESYLITLQSEQDQLLAQNAKTTLITQYPELDFNTLNWSYKPSSEFTFELVNMEIATSPQQQIAELQEQKSQLQAKRAKLNRIPDPTLGLSTFDEFDGSETGVMAQFSFPIVGRARKAASEQADQYAAVDTLKLETAIRQAKQERTIAKQNATAAIASYQTAQSAVELSQQALERVRQGYSLGAITISELISMRRIHQQVERAYQSQRSATDRALLKLLVMSKQVFVDRNP